jgi:hypothetical protein
MTAAPLFRRAQGKFLPSATRSANRLIEQHRLRLRVTRRTPVSVRRSCGALKGPIRRHPGAMQYETAGRCTSRYTRNMQAEYMQAMLAGAWMLLIGILGYVAGIASPVGWTGRGDNATGNRAALLGWARSNDVGDYPGRASLI